MAKQIVNKDNIVIPAGTQEDFRRPDHPDFALVSELRDQHWSGIRHNSITNNAEIWVDGSIKEIVTREQILLNPHALSEAMQEVFALPHVLPDTPECRAYGQELARIKEYLIAVRDMRAEGEVNNDSSD